MDIANIVLNYFGTSNDYLCYVKIDDSWPIHHVSNLFVDINGIDMNTYSKRSIIKDSKNITLSVTLNENNCKDEIYDKNGYKVEIGLIGFKNNLINLDTNNTKSTSLFLNKGNFFNSFGRYINPQKRQNRCGAATIKQKRLKRIGFNQWERHWISCMKTGSLMQTIGVSNNNQKHIEKWSNNYQLQWENDTKLCATVNLQTKTIQYHCVENRMNGNTVDNIIHESKLKENMIYVFFVSLLGCSCGKLSNSKYGLQYKIHVNVN